MVSHPRYSNRQHHAAPVVTQNNGKIVRHRSGRKVAIHIGHSPATVKAMLSKKYAPNGDRERARRMRRGELP
jgi:hypothetical protein